MAFTWNRNEAPVTVAPAGAPISLPETTGPTDDERAKVAQILVDLFGYLRTNAPSHEALAPVFKDMQAAVAAFASRQPGDPFAPIMQVLATIEAQRRVDPGIPEP
jgi:hypothetical protein